MKILFLSYWSVDDGLSRATVLPHIRILSGMANVEKIIYCSIERSKKGVADVDLGERVIHVPLYSGVSYLHKVFDFIYLPKRLSGLVRQHGIDLLICRGAPAGSLGYLVYRHAGIPYIVESFEPHALYMVESGIWRRGGLRDRSQTRWESKQLKTADHIITVSRSYRDFLAKAGIDRSRLHVVPCAVDAEKFALKDAARSRLREQFGFADSSIVGIYTGKFGGMYYDDDAFEIFRQAFSVIPHFRLLILTPNSSNVVEGKLVRASISPADFYVARVPHDTVPDFLSSADIAFALYKPSASKRFLSPVKVGEYWASGLPVLLSKGVGDDSDVIESEGGGFTFRLEESGSLQKALKAIHGLVLKTSRQELSQNISGLAKKYRSLEQVRIVYEKILFQY